MIKTGLVMQAEKNTATIMCSSGMFYKVKFSGKPPKIGEEFTGKVITKYKLSAPKLIAAACMFFILLIGGSYYAYCVPTATIVVNINPSIQIKTNIFNKIIALKALNNDGVKILNDIKITNKSLNTGLNSIIEQAKKDNFINDKYIKNGTSIQIQITSKNNTKIDLSAFERNISNSNLNVDINNAGLVKHIEGSKSIDKNPNVDTKVFDGNNKTDKVEPKNNSVIENNNTNSNDKNNNSTDNNSHSNSNINKNPEYKHNDNSQSVPSNNIKDNSSSSSNKASKEKSSDHSVDTNKNNKTKK